MEWIDQHSDFESSTWDLAMRIAKREAAALAIQVEVDHSGMAAENTCLLVRVAHDDLTLPKFLRY